MGGRLKRLARLGLLEDAAIKQQRLAQEDNLRKLKRQHAQSTGSAQAPSEIGVSKSPRRESRELSPYAAKLQRRKEAEKAVEQTAADDVGDAEVVVEEVAEAAPFPPPSASPSPPPRPAQHYAFTTPRFTGKIFRTPAYKGLGKTSFAGLGLSSASNETEGAYCLFVALETARNQWLVSCHAGPGTTSPKGWKLASDSTVLMSPDMMAKRLRDLGRHAAGDPAAQSVPVNFFRPDALLVSVETVLDSDSSASAAPAPAISAPPAAHQTPAPPPRHTVTILKTLAYKGIGRIPFAGLEELSRTNGQDSTYYLYVAAQIAPNQWRIAKYTGNDIHSREGWQIVASDRPFFATPGAMLERIRNWSRHVANYVAPEYHAVNFIYPDAREITALTVLDEESPIAPTVPANVKHAVRPPLAPEGPFITRAFSGAAGVKYIQNGRLSIRIDFSDPPEDCSCKDMLVAASRQNGSWHIMRYAGNGPVDSDWRQISDVTVFREVTPREIIRLLQTWSFAAARHAASHNSTGYNMASLVPGAQLIQPDAPSQHP